MIVLVTGATGFIGRSLSARLASDGHTLRVLTRDPEAASARSGLPPGTRFHAWPAGGPVPDAAVEGAEAVVHLAGENIGAWPWSPQRKRRILESRVHGTRSLVEAMGRCASRNGGAGREGCPAVLVAASAVGYYGDAGGESLAETHAPGKGFLAEVCMDWEREIFHARDLGIRTVAVRNGLVLGHGGALEKMAAAFRLGGGAVLGSGRQWWSWIHVEDTAGIFAHALGNAGLEGAVNGCAPAPVTQRDFARALADVLKRPMPWKVPAFAMRLVLGEMASTVLDSQKADASKLARGYAFRYGTLERALENLTTGGRT